MWSSSGTHEKGTSCFTPSDEFFPHTAESGRHLDYCYVSALIPQAFSSEHCRGMEVNVMVKLSLQLEGKCFPWLCMDSFRLVIELVSVI